MATQKAYNNASDFIKKNKVKDITTGDLVVIDLSFLGIENLVSQSELSAMSESEQCRHKQEDEMLASIYGEN